jgi:hypothetical protein
VGRVDLRIAQGGDNEIYVISKSDGSIRKMTASLGPPLITSITNSSSDVILTWQAIPGWKITASNTRFPCWTRPS